MGSVVVLGGSLPGIAAAARLAKAGHEVTLVERSPRLGARWAEPGAWAPMFVFPAPLRDLFRKSGRGLDAEFGRRGLRLVPAPPAVHEFPDGTRWTWPADRAGQWHLLAERASPALATHWRDTLDGYDETWQVLRHLALEGELADAAQLRHRRGQLRQNVTIEALARHVVDPRLGELVREVAWRSGSTPRDTPAWLATRLSVERTFGRWMIVDALGAVQPAAVVLDILGERLATRGVRVLTGAVATRIGPAGVSSSEGEHPADVVISAVNPWGHSALVQSGTLGARRAASRISPALAPTVTVRLDAPGAEAGEHVRHTPAGPVVTYTRPVEGATEVVVHDHTRSIEDRGYGVRWRGARTWLRMPALRTAGSPWLFAASASSRAGNEPWAQLLSGAQATYAIHELLTGEDIRPTNRDYRP